MQAAQLRDDEEQSQHQRTPGVEEVLPLVPDAYTAQRDALALACLDMGEAGPRAGFSCGAATHTDEERPEWQIRAGYASTA